MLTASPMELPLVIVKINGRGPYQFILDTGASSCCVSKELASELGIKSKSSKLATGANGSFLAKEGKLVLRPLYIDGPVSHQAVRCGFIFMSHSGSMAIKNKPANDRLKAHPKGANQCVELYVLAVRHGITMALQRRLDLNALVCAGTSI